MSCPFIRNLSFQFNDLSKEVMIMLTLINGDLKGLYEDFFLIVWKVSTFRKTGAYRAQVTYTNQLAFSKTQVVNGNVISTGTCVKINDSEKTTLTQANDVYHFSPPQVGTSGILQAVNRTGAVQDLAVSFLNKGDLMPMPALYFNKVDPHSPKRRDESSVKAQFTPILHVYITSDYQETAILRGAINTPVIWMQDLAVLAENTTWNLKCDMATGRYTVIQA
ncbi:hypothetical protein DFJ58DRAFT_846954 [Suillus subalutaceus]|uniref:uncharacterized protein n=1 Tax=Suillus subalutaceus TaxID=48586 RepID=UPI001B87E02B|nr:uncharacterized protein DFJ58DRAFT_846954 [Suillus subalutaceus]KAG1836442.1 hypothetical protein DFJ58DRAFT_846954 [Suillus subalutaceus]